MQVPQLPAERLGRYTLVERLSESFFGPRWAAKRSDGDPTDELVAIRCVNARLLSDEQTIDRLANAGWWAMEVEHPHALGVCDVVLEDGRLGIITPFHEGDTLRLLLRRAHRERKTIPVPVVVSVLLDVLDAIGAVARMAGEESDSHSHVHGGVTPDSVHVGTDGVTRLLDVGVAAMASGDHSWDDDPVRAAYDPPERERGKPLDARADVFVCGILAWEMLTREHLFSGTSVAEVTRKVREMPIPSLDGRARTSGDDAEVTALAAVVSKALARDPAARFESPAAMAGALRALPVTPATPEEVGRCVRELGGRVAKARRLRMGTTDAPPEELVAEEPGVQLEGIRPSETPTAPPPPMIAADDMPPTFAPEPAKPRVVAPAPPPPVGIAAPPPIGTPPRAPSPPAQHALPELALIDEPDSEEAAHTSLEGHADVNVDGDGETIDLGDVLDDHEAEPAVTSESASDDAAADVQVEDQVDFHDLVPTTGSTPSALESDAAESPRLSDPSPASLTLGDLPPLPPPRRRGALLGGAVLLLTAIVILFFAVRGGDGSTPETAARPDKEPSPAGAATKPLPAEPASQPVRPTVEPAPAEGPVATAPTEPEEPADTTEPEPSAELEPKHAPSKKPKLKRRKAAKQAPAFIPDDI